MLSEDVKGVANIAAHEDLGFDYGNLSLFGVGGKVTISDVLL